MSQHMGGWERDGLIKNLPSRKVPAADQGGVADLLQKLGYQAHTESAPSKTGLPILTAHNCVYHDLATNPPEVCTFDIALLEQLVNRKVGHQECMVKGGHACR